MGGVGNRVANVASHIVDNSTSGTYNLYMHPITFIELPNFTRNVYRYLSDEAYYALQAYLMHHPDAGDVIRDSGGCRKLRWGTEGRGKRGGVRVIYYYRRANGQMWMLTIYAKNEAENIPGHILRRFKEEIDRAK